MTTSKPRVLVTLDPDTYEVLRRLAEVTARSMSSIIAQAFVSAAPALRASLVAAELADKQFWTADEKLCEAVGEAQRTLAIAASQAAPPPSSNTGVGFRSQGSAKGIRRGKL